MGIGSNYPLSYISLKMSILETYSIKNEANVHLLKYFKKFEGQIQCQNEKIKAFDSSLATNILT